jgi:hypothetical protein
VRETFSEDDKRALLHVLKRKALRGSLAATRTLMGLIKEADGKEFIDGLAEVFSKNPLPDDDPDDDLDDELEAE